MAKAKKPQPVSLGTAIPTVLAIDTTSDPVTLAGFQYREANVYPAMAPLGFTIDKCQGPLARRWYVAPKAALPQVVYLTGVGHGSYDTYTGQNGDPIFQIGNYQATEVAGKIVHLLSCQTARDLGRDMVTKGCKAFFGYDENFTFYMDDADIFFACDAEIDLGFASGLTAAQVHVAAVAMYDVQIQNFMAAGKPYQAAALQFDRDHLFDPVSGGAPWGDPAASLY